MNQSSAPRLEVLLSTHNGARHLPALLNSLRLQSYDRGKWTLRVRDDGSTDDTRHLLARWSGDAADPPLEAGPRLGAAHSFFRLIQAASESSVDMVALCDQDDVWMPDKLAVGVTALADVTVPALYCSRILVTDESLSRRRPNRLARRGPSFENALVENIATGATIILNRPALELSAAHVPRSAVMHDAWLYLLLSGTGRVIYDPVPRMLYRQHAGNAIGIRMSRSADWWRRGRNHLRVGGEHWLLAQATELAETYSYALRPEARVILTDFLGNAAGIRGRLRYALTGAAHRQRTIDDLIYRALFALGRI